MFFAYYFLLYFTNIYNGVWEENTFCFIFWGFVMDGSDTVGGKLFLIYCVNSLEKFRNFISRVVFVECPCFGNDRTKPIWLKFCIKLVYFGFQKVNVCPFFQLSRDSRTYGSWKIRGFCSSIISFHPTKSCIGEKMLHGNFIPRWTLRVYKKNI